MSRWFTESQRPALGMKMASVMAEATHVHSERTDHYSMSTQGRKRWKLWVLQLRSAGGTAEELERAEESRRTAHVRIYGWFHEGPAACRRFTCVVLMASATLMRSPWMSLCQWRCSWPLQSECSVTVTSRRRKPLNLRPLIIMHTLHNYIR